MVYTQAKGEDENTYNSQGIPPKWHEIPVIGLAGFMFAGVMGFWLLVSILRRGRM